MKPWSYADFETYRPLNTKFIRDCVSPHIENPECKRILFKAPVKSGKRGFVEILALRDHSSARLNRKHLFISAWHRTDDESQRIELTQHNLLVMSINNKKNKEKCIKQIEKLLNVIVKHLMI